MIGRFINADDVELVLIDPTTLTDKNLYAYCDNNPVMCVDQNGEMWELAIAGGGTMAFSSGLSMSTIVAGLSAVAPVAIAVATTVVVVVGVSAAIKYAKSKSNEKSKEDVDPYARPGQKKQGREKKNKNRRNDNFEDRSNKRTKKPPKHHTPGKDHQKYDQKR